MKLKVVNKVLIVKKAACEAVEDRRSPGMTPMLDSSREVTNVRKNFVDFVYKGIFFIIVVYLLTRATRYEHSLARSKSDLLLQKKIRFLGTIQRLYKVNTKWTSKQNVFTKVHFSLP